MRQLQRYNHKESYTNHIHWITQITDVTENIWKRDDESPFFKLLADKPSDYIGNVLGLWKMHELLINEAFSQHFHIHKGV